MTMVILNKLKEKAAATYRRYGTVEITEQYLLNRENRNLTSKEKFIAFTYVDRRNSIISRVAHIIFLTSVPPYFREVAKYVAHKKWKLGQLQEMRVRYLF